MAFIRRPLEMATKSLREELNENNHGVVSECLSIFENQLITTRATPEGYRMPSLPACLFPQ